MPQGAMWGGQSRVRAEREPGACAFVSICALEFLGKSWIGQLKSEEPDFGTPQGGLA